MFRRIVAAVLLTGAATFAVAAPASALPAHNAVVATTPADGSTLTALPPQFSITTNEALLDLGGRGNGFAIEVEDANGLFYGDGCASIVDKTLSAVPQIGAAGAYRVIYQLVSSDGHTVSGQLHFTWAPPAGFTPAIGSPSSPVCPGSTAGGSTGSTGSPGGPGGQATASGSAQAVPLGDVLTVGGAIVAVLLAVGIAVLVVTRKRRSAE